MDLPPINDKRCDNKMCRYASACNVLALLLTLILITGFAQADMSLSRMIVDFKADDAHHQDIQIFNKDKDNTYVNINVVEVLNPGSDKEERVPVQDLKTLSLVVTPKKLIVPGNSQKTVRLVTLEDAGKTDRIFRVDFSPAVGKLKAKTSGIKLLVAYQALVIIRPDKPMVNVSAERKGKIIVFRNTGNTNALLQNGSQCNPANTKECKTLSARRLYAGNSWELELPYNAPVSFEVDDGQKVTSRTFGNTNSKKLVSR